MKTVEYRKILEKTQWLKRNELEDLQQKKMNALLKHAYENVPYYHKLFMENKIKPSDIKTIQDLKKLPVLKKTMIQKTPREFEAKNIPNREIIPYQTGGTTANPLNFNRTKEDKSKRTRF